MPLPHLRPGFARALRAVGSVLMGSGILVLLFVAYQLWGTGLQQSQAQNRLSDEFASQIESFGDTDGEASSTTSSTVGSEGTSPSSTTTSTTSLEDVDPAVLDALTPEPGDPVARLLIPSIGVDQIVVHGVDLDDLRLGPGHFPETPMPGQPGNSAIAGHRTTHGQPFHDLDRVVPGDEIVVETIQGRFTYEVMPHPADDGTGESGHLIVGADAVEVVDDAGDDRITLVACHPKYSAAQRIVVTGLLREEPAPVPELPEPPDEGDPSEESDGAPASEDLAGADDALDGDRGALLPTLLWSGAFLLALAAVIVAGHLWRRWPAYAIGAPFLAVVLWATFENLDRYLPAY